MIRKIALGAALGVAALLGFASTRPDQIRVTRSATVKAPPDALFALVNDFHRWGTWSPWEKLDPNMRRTHGGPPSGKGAVYEWDGNHLVGQGRMQILESVATSKIVIKLDFVKPIEGHNTAEFTFRTAGDSTEVTWLMFGPNSLMGKVFGLFMDMDAMIGKDFETGLANLRRAVET